MRFSTAIAALAATLPFSQALYQGFNVAANNPDNSCKTTAQWKSAFSKLKTGLPQSFPNVRLYAASDCNTLEYAVPAAISTGTKILVGIWAEDETHYTNEKNALLAAIKAHGTSWILAISVGSEDLYRGDTDASTLAGQIYDVRGMVHQYNKNLLVGHVDTWTAWVDTANDAVITACDFIGMDGYPYFQDSAIGSAKSVFWKSVKQTQAAVNAVSGSSGKPVWVTETGWPVSGPAAGAAIASVANAQAYWKAVYCSYSSQVSMFWYVYQDYGASPSFGIFNKAGKAIFDLAAC